MPTPVIPVEEVEFNTSDFRLGYMRQGRAKEAGVKPGSLA